MKITIKEVAKLANVSQSTVSRVIHDSPRISEDTKKRVKEVMKELGYYKNLPILQHVQGATKTIALLLRDYPDDFATNPFFIRLMQGASQYAREYNYHIMYAFYKDNQDELNFINDYIKSRIVKGLMLCLTLKEDPGIEYMNSKNYPFVVIGRPENLQDTYWVDNDNFQAMYDCVNYHIKKGKTKIAFISNSLTFDALKYRMEGYKQGLRSWGIDLDTDLIELVNEYSEEAAYQAMHRILNKAKPDAVVTTDDILAFGAIKAIKEKKCRIAVTGFNNSSRGIYQSPSLSSVDINPDKLGMQAAKLLISQIEGEELQVKHYIVETSLIERQTTIDDDWV